MSRETETNLSKFFRRNQQDIDIWSHAALTHTFRCSHTVLRSSNHSLQIQTVSCTTLLCNLLGILSLQNKDHNATDAWFSSTWRKLAIRHRTKTCLCFFTGWYTFHVSPKRWRWRWDTDPDSWFPCSLRRTCTCNQELGRCKHRRCHKDSRHTRLHRFLQQEKLFSSSNLFPDYFDYFPALVNQYFFLPDVSGKRAFEEQRFSGWVTKDSTGNAGMPCEDWLLQTQDGDANTNVTTPDSTIVSIFWETSFQACNAFLAELLLMVPTCTVLAGPVASAIAKVLKDAILAGSSVLAGVRRTVIFIRHCKKKQFSEQRN